MLTNWKVTNFKSLSNVTIPLAPINVFAGANSSGKSTIIQSILIIKQTLQYAAAARSIALNGPLVKLGSFDDVKNFFTTDDYLSLGFSLNVASAFPGRAIRGPISSFGRVALSSVEFEGRWDVPPQSDDADRPRSDELRKLQPKLRSASLRAHRREPERKPTSLTIGRLDPLQASPTPELPTFYAAGRAEFAVDEIDDGSKRELLGGRADARLNAVMLSHFLPSQIAVAYDADKQRARAIAEAICSDPAPFDDFDQDDDLDDGVPSVVLAVVKQWLMERGAAQAATQYLSDIPLDDENDLVDLKGLIERFRYARSEISRDSTEGSQAVFDTSDLKARIIEAFTTEVDRGMQVEFEITRTISASNDIIRSYFLNNVRYLGPLRDEPRHVYPLEALANPSDVGYKGEHTAAVLELNGERTIDYVPSAGFASDSDAQWSRTASASLKDAVIDWLQYVGVAIEVETQDSGVFGHQMKVKTDKNNRYHDLTNVGVGVSQVLPIIVGSLLAPRGACLIFEQPELHLHPKVQARLADFFLAMSFSGKQCVLETHSEYMVDRLRLRIAQSSSSEFAGRINLYFTSMLNGNTTCDPVEISEYGAVVKWPNDFFDESQKGIESIIKAASQKRERERINRKQDLSDKPSH